MNRPVYNIKLFSYDKDTKTFVAEASSLGIPVGVMYPTEFTIKNFQTGNAVSFRYAYEQCDSEGELQYSVYFRKACGFDDIMYRVRIYND